MEFFDVINKRRTVRDFENKEVPQDVLEKVFDAGLKAPSGNHLRDMHFVVVRGQNKIAEVLKMVDSCSDMQSQFVDSMAGKMDDCQHKMYLDALPRQMKMLMTSGTLILPFYNHGGNFDKSEGVTTYNNFASTWCGIENMMLAATAEGLACSIRIPIGSEPEYVNKVVGVPEGYVLCCYLGIGYPAKDAVMPNQIPATIEAKVHWDRW